MEREREKGEIYRRVRDRKGLMKRERNREEMEIYVMYIHVHVYTCTCIVCVYWEGEWK